MPSSKTAPAEGPSDASDLRTIDVFQNVDTSTLERVLPLFQRKQVRARRPLTLRRHFGGHLCFAWSGRYRMLATTPSGGSITLYSLTRGGVFNQSLITLGAEASDQVRLVADEPGFVLMLDSDKADQLIDHNPAFARGLMHALALLNVSYAQRIFEIAALDARALILAELSRLADQGVRHGDGIVIAPAPTQSIMAQQLGLTREAVSRNLRALAEEGLVRMTRGRITLPDIDRLRANHRIAAGANLVHQPKRS